jgi:predicted nucleotidyltransferase
MGAPVAVWAFGSRVNGRAKKYSDLDIAVLSDKPLSLYDYATLKEAFDESDLPYRVDIVDWAAVTETFQAIIQKNKITIQPKVL